MHPECSVLGPAFTCTVGMLCGALHLTSPASDLLNELPGLAVGLSHHCGLVQWLWLTLAGTTRPALLLFRFCATASDVLACLTVTLNFQFAFPFRSARSCRTSTNSNELRPRTCILRVLGKHWCYLLSQFHANWR